MENILVENVIQAVNGKLICGNPYTPINSICTDTRAIKPGELFIPLEGEKFDGHNFLKEAWLKGAHGFLINENDRKGWYDKMKWFVDNPSAIKEMGEALNELVLERYTLERINKNRAEFFKAICK